MTTHTSPGSVLAISDRAAPQLRMYHSGGWHEARSGKTFTTSNPATGELLAHLPDGDEHDLDLAVDGARDAQRDWAATPMMQRVAALRQLADRVSGEAERFGELDARDNGSPWTDMHADALKGASAMRYMAGLALEMKGDTIPLRADGLHYTTLNPWGVVARIIAFNHPTLFVCGRLAPALIAGNAAVLKMPELAPLAGLAVAELAEDLFPPGLLSVLTGGPRLGAAIARHPELRRLSFTGSVATALKIGEGIAQSGVIKTVTYELGGKNPILVFPDADLDTAADAVVRGMNFTRVQGQSCGSTSRLFAHADVHDELVERVEAQVRQIRIGPPIERDTEMGTLINRQSRDRCVGYVSRAKEGGARLVTGGSAPDDQQLAAGAFMLPTVLTDVDPGSELAQTEIFGPVLATHRWTSVEDAVRQANDVRYGLTAAVWTNDISQGLRTADQLEAGYIWVNDVETRYPAVPFGGWKDSGTGLEHGIEELLSFTRTKAINVTYR